MSGKAHDQSPPTEGFFASGLLSNPTETANQLTSVRLALAKAQAALPASGKQPARILDAVRASSRAGVAQGRTFFRLSPRGNGSRCRSAIQARRLILAGSFFGGAHLIKTFILLAGTCDAQMPELRCDCIEPGVL